MTRFAATLLAATTAMAVALCAGAALAQGDRSEGPAVAASPLVCALPTNCVNSLGAGGLQPLRFDGSAEMALARLQATIATFDEARVTSQEPLRVEAIFSTPAGFKDRVEFVIDVPAARIDYRSYSMFGIFDWGKNRSRMVEFGERFSRPPPR